MNHIFDVIVVGLGGMGSAAAYHLAKRGQRVLGLDRFHPPHAFGSSHGHTRIIRQSYLEGSFYVPMVQRAYELWRDLEKETGKHLLAEIGGLMIGPRGCSVVDGAIRSADCHELPYEILSPRDVAERFPAFHLADDEVAVYEKVAGTLFPEACIEAHLNAAARNGLEIHTNEPVLKWSVSNGGVIVHTQKGTYYGERLILTAGSWNPELFGFSIPLEVERKVPAWFQPARRPEAFHPGTFPVFVWHYNEGLTLYGLPGFHGEGTKVAFHQGGLKGRPEDLPRQASIDEIEEIRQIVQNKLPDLDIYKVTVDTCLYTNTPDGHFVLGVHPHYPNVAIAGGCSGHGFKFCSVIGEILADLTTVGKTDYDISHFDPTRFDT